MRQYLNFLADEHPEVVEAMRPEFDNVRQTVQKNPVVPSRLFIDFLEESARVGRQQDIGVQFSARLNVYGFGPACFAWASSTNLRGMAELWKDYMHVENESIVVEIVEDDDAVSWVTTSLERATHGSRQFHEALLALIVRLVREFLCPDWKPHSVELEHAILALTPTHRAFFGERISENSDRYAVRVTKADMEARFATGNPHLQAFIMDHLRERGFPEQRNVSTLARDAIARRLPSGSMRMSDVATVLHISERTLQRRLAEEGYSFGALLSEVRVTNATRYLQNTPEPTLAQLTQVLGFSDFSSASHFLKEKLGRGLRDGCVGRGR